MDDNFAIAPKGFSQVCMHQYIFITVKSELALFWL